MGGFDPMTELRLRLLELAVSSGAKDHEVVQVANELLGFILEPWAEPDEQDAA